MAGVAKAPDSSAAVSTHSPVLNETRSDRAIEGMSGAPRLLTIATRAATVTKTGKVARVRHRDRRDRRRWRSVP